MKEGTDNVEKINMEFVLENLKKKDPFKKDTSCQDENKNQYKDESASQIIENNDVQYEKTSVAERQEEFPEKNNFEENLEEKLEEVDFYYQLSRQKKEALQEKGEPFYYLKAQKLLQKLKNTFGDDYRIWWELSKPLDYLYEEEVKDGAGAYKFNKVYFDKALDLADISSKKELVLALDTYEQKKQVFETAYKEEIERKRREEEEQRAREEEQRQENERKKQEEEERRQEEERRKIIEEKIRREKEERLLLEQIANENVQIYNKLSEKDYSLLDGAYFKFSSADQKEHIIIFKEISNVLYLLSFSKESKKNILYNDQSIAILVNADGEIIKYDNQNLRMRASGSVLRISSDGRGGLIVGEWKVYNDMKFVRTVMQSAKKPLLSLEKIFY